MYSNYDSRNIFLQLNTKTWNKETEDLFDFEAKDIIDKEFKFGYEDASNFLIIHDEKIAILNNIQDIKKRISEKSNTKILGEISSLKNGLFQISNSMSSKNLKSFDKSNLDRLWVVLSKNDSRAIEEGDIIKLGRVRLKVDKIEIKRESISNSEENCHNNSGCNYLKTNTTVQIIHNNMLNVNMAIFHNNNLNQIRNNNNSVSFNDNMLDINFPNEINIIDSPDSSLNRAHNIDINHRGATLPRGNSIMSQLENEKTLCDKKPIVIISKMVNALTKDIANCRICFRSDSDFEDPLVSPCKCSGSIGHIHYKCLKQCINVKLNTKIGDDYMTFIWKNFECEICLTEYPKYLRYKSTCYYLVDLNITFDQYIIFDYTLYDDIKKRSSRKGIIVVKIDDDEDISIGRTQTNTLKLKDISVSRNHCVISKKDDKIYISDKGSKFGTLIYLSKPFVVYEKSFVPNLNHFEGMDVFYGDSLELVTGKNLFNFNSIKKWSLFSNLFSSAMCCNYKRENKSEFILDSEEIVCKNPNDPNKRNSGNNINLGVNPILLYDSYCDHILNLDTIIRHEDEDE